MLSVDKLYQTCCSAVMCGILKPVPENVLSATFNQGLVKRYALPADVWNNVGAPPIAVKTPARAGFSWEDIALNKGAAYVGQGSVEGRSWNG